MPGPAVWELGDWPSLAGFVRCIAVGGSLAGVGLAEVAVGDDLVRVVTVGGGLAGAVGGSLAGGDGLATTGTDRVCFRLAAILGTGTPPAKTLLT